MNFRYLILPFYLLLAFLAYREGLSVFIPADNYGMLYFYEKGNILAQTDLNDNATPQLLSAFLLYILYKIIGLSSAGWVSVSVLLHAVNAWLVFRITEKWLERSTTKPFMASLFAALLFLLSPYQAETVLWTPTNISILLATFFFLSALLSWISWIRNGRSQTLWMSQLFFLAAVFSYEITLAWPAIATLIFIWFQFHKTSDHSTVFGKNTFEPLRSRLLLPLLIQLLIIFSYFLSTRLIFGSWVLHSGGAEDFISETSPFLVLGKYFLKFIFLYRYSVPDAWDAWLRNTEQGGWLALLVLSGLAAVFYFILRKKRTETISILVLVGCFILSLAPVLMLDSSFLHYIYPDRYGYLGSAFFYMAIAAAGFFFLRPFFLPVLTGCTVLFILFLGPTVSAFQKTSDQCNRLLNDFRPLMKHEKIYVLSFPAYANGVAAFRTGFRPAVYLSHEPFELDRITIAAQHYQDSPADTIRSVHRSGDTIRVEGPVRPTPFFSTGGGWAKSFETEDIRAEFAEDGCSYRLTFNRTPPPDHVIVYSSGDTWKILAEQQ